MARQWGGGAVGQQWRPVAGAGRREEARSRAWIAAPQTRIQQHPRLHRPTTRTLCGGGAAQVVGSQGRGAAHSVQVRRYRRATAHSAHVHCEQGRRRVHTHTRGNTAATANAMRGGVEATAPAAYSGGTQGGAEDGGGRKHDLQIDHARLANPTCTHTPRSGQHTPALSSTSLAAQQLPSASISRSYGQHCPRRSTVPLQARVLVRAVGNEQSTPAKPGRHVQVRVVALHAALPRQEPGAPETVPGTHTHTSPRHLRGSAAVVGARHGAQRRQVHNRRGRRQAGKLREHTSLHATHGRGVMRGAEARGEAAPRERCASAPVGGGAWDGDVGG